MNNKKLKNGQIITFEGDQFRVNRLLFKCNQNCSLKEFRACSKYTASERLKLNQCLKLIKWENQEKIENISLL